MGDGMDVCGLLGSCEEKGARVVLSVFPAQFWWRPRDVLPVETEEARHHFEGLIRNHQAALRLCGFNSDSRVYSNPAQSHID